MISPDGLREQALALTADRRAELALSIVSSLSDDLATPEEIERAWVAVAVRRVAEMRDDDSLWIPWEDVMAKVHAIVTGEPETDLSPDERFEVLVRTAIDRDAEERESLLRAVLVSVDLQMGKLSDDEWVLERGEEVKRQLLELREGRNREAPPGGCSRGCGCWPVGRCDQR